MTNIELFSLVPALVLTGICVYTDIRYYKVSNKVLAGFLLAAIVINVFKGRLWPHGLEGLVLPFVICIIPYKCRAIGAGDVKLYCVIGAYIGRSMILSCMIWSLCIAAVMSVAKFVSVSQDYKNYARRFGRELTEIINCEKISDIRSELRIHYTIAIMLGLIVAVLREGGV